MRDTFALPEQLAKALDLRFVVTIDELQERVGYAQACFAWAGRQNGLPADLGRGADRRVVAGAYTSTKKPRFIVRNESHAAFLGSALLRICDLRCTILYRNCQLALIP